MRWAGWLVGCARRIAGAIGGMRDGGSAVDLLPARVGLVLIVVGVLVAPQTLSLPHTVVLLGAALAGLGLAKVQARGRPAHPASAPGAQGSDVDAIESKVETLRDVVWELRESEARYRDLLDTQEQIIVRYDPAGRLTFVNRAFCRVFGVTPADVLGRTWQPQVAAQEPSSAQTHSGPRRRYTELVETADGRRWLAFEEHRVPGLSPGKDEVSAGRADEVQLVATDVTEARAAAALLASARDQAQAADRAKSRFLAAMSHEIRTPMNGIMGMASLLGDTGLSSEQRTYLGAIDQSASTLLLLIDEILDFSKIEAGKLVLAAEPFALDACVQGAVELLAPAAHEKGLELAWTVPPELPSALVGDQARVRQIVLNLVGNAVKYTDRGGVLVTVEHAMRDDGAAQISIRVKDTGIGLTREAMDRLFSEFNQGDAENALRRGGTGLGLAISRRLARAMDGDVTVTSEPGRGATFTADLVLPVGPGARAVLEKVGSGKAAGHVLLALDNRIERRALSTCLRSIGFDVIEADEMTAEGDHDAVGWEEMPISFVVCDAQCDPGEAAETLAQARKSAGGREVKGVLLIDSVTRPSLEQFRAAGFTSYLVRPVRPSALLARFGVEPASVAFDERAEAPADAEAVASGEFEGRHVLLAEDNAVNALLARRMLEKAGCTVVHAEDGEAAVVEVSRAMEPGGQPFDLVLMDLHMPRLDGLSAAARIRAIAGGMGRSAELPPIVALTANAFAEDRERCLAGGLDDYLAKPFHRNELRDLLARWDRQRRRSAA